MAEASDLVSLVIQKTKDGRLEWHVEEPTEFAGAAGMLPSLLVRPLPYTAVASLRLPDGTDAVLRFRFPSPAKWAQASMGGLALEVLAGSEVVLPMSEGQARELAEAITGMRDSLKEGLAEALKSL